MIFIKQAFIILVLLFFHLFAFGQKKSKFKSFKALSYPEKFWVFTHPFIAKKSFSITQEVQREIKEMATESIIDNDSNGGQLDAFRHAFWMAMLVQEIAPRKAYKLGKSHEKGNYRDFKKNRLEEGALPDKISSEMDLWNNKIGILIGEKNSNSDSDQLKKLVIEAIQAGEMRIIKKDIDGNFLDKDGKIIPLENIDGSWKNNKCLVPSDYKP